MNKRTKELDGLRGIAVFIVIAFHVFERANAFTHNKTLYFITSLTTFGWVGVDIFFVLSGFLITAILLKSKTETNYFRNFYARRALRIFPLYYIFLISIFFLIPVIDPAFTSDLHRVLPYFLLYIQNWVELTNGIVPTPYLVHTWSLAIEEQYYFIWPAIVYFFQREALIKISATVIVISIFARILSFTFGNNAVFMANFFYSNTFTRFEQFSFGALLAISLANPIWKDRIRNGAFVVFATSFATFLALGMASFPNVGPDKNLNYFTVSEYTLTAVFSTALIAIFMTHSDKSIIRRLFQSRILVFFGRYSYSMYLIHLPISLFLWEPLLNTHIRGWKIYLFYIVITYILTILVSLLTWHLLEKHFLNMKKYFETNVQAKND